VIVSVRKEKRMTKDDLLGIFRTCHNNCKLVYASMVLFGHEDMAKFFTAWDAKLNLPKPYPDSEILPLLYDREVLKHAFVQLYDTVHRTALTDLFEMTKDYCKETGQEAVLQQQPWYQFWRILRNCFSHDFVFTFTQYDRERLPVTWDNLTLDSFREGTQLTHGEFPREKIWVFLRQIELFIEKNLA
jgi:hypothetical protein